MEPKFINQEILLFTGTVFCSRSFSERDCDHDSCDNYSSMEELEKACWNGMLQEMLPELVNGPGNATIIMCGTRSAA